MNIARPPGGFNVIVSERVRQYIESECADLPRLAAHWRDVLGLAKITILRDGEQIKGKGPPRFIFIADGRPEYGLPTIKIVCDIFGEDMTVGAALVYREADYGYE